MCWKIVEHYPTIFGVINVAVRSHERNLERLIYADNLQAVKNNGGFPEKKDKKTTKKVKKAKK